MKNKGSQTYVGTKICYANKSAFSASLGIMKKLNSIILQQGESDLSQLKFQPSPKILKYTPRTINFYSPKYKIIS